MIYDNVTQYDILLLLAAECTMTGTLTDTDISEEESVTPALKLDQWESSFPQV